MGKKVSVFFLRRRGGAGAVALCLALLLLVRGLAAGEPARSALAPALFGASIVIDAGHGGADPGMVGSAAVEKEINLAVAGILADYCRQAGATVTLTRDQDGALAETKREDMAARVALTEEVQADVFISLHCNSFVYGPAQHGAQVFYAGGNAEGQRLAETLQSALVSQLGNTDRAALAHPDSYLLKNIDGAAVIVEMGFLSNAEEQQRLSSPAYQWELGWALFLGLNDYLAQAAIEGTTPPPE